VAKRELGKQAASIGDGIAAKYFGKRPGKDGTEYKAWRVLVEAAQPAENDDASPSEPEDADPPDDDIPY
jgi:hypothetical protein